MTSDSSTGGALLPASGEPLEDDTLDDFFQGWVVGITGIAGQYVRPRWQQDPPDLPPRSVTWAAIGITNRRPDGIASEVHGSASQGTSTVTRHETLDLMCSFYGPAAQAMAQRLQTGAFLAQNREALLALNMGLVDVGDPNRAPELIKNQFLNRTDVTVQIRRQVSVTYAVLNVLSAEATLETESLTDTINVNP